MLKFTINKSYATLDAWLRAIPAAFDTEQDVIHDGRNTIKTMTAPDGRRFVVKRYHKSMLLNRIVYSTGIRKSKGLRAYTYSFRLLDAGIETPESVAYIEDRHAGLIGYSFYVSLLCPYAHRMYELGDAAPDVYTPIALSLAALAARMHEAGILHLDFSPGNILWDKTADGTIHFSLVDTNRMRFGTVSAKDGLDNFRRLWGPKQFFVMLVREYARLRGFDADEAERYALDRRARFWRHYMKKRRVEFHLDL